MVMIVNDTNNTARRRLSTTGGWRFFSDGSFPAKTRYRWRSTLPPSNPTSGPSDAASATSACRASVPGIVLLSVAGRLTWKI